MIIFVLITVKTIFLLKLNVTGSRSRKHRRCQFPFRMRQRTIRSLRTKPSNKKWTGRHSHMSIPTIRAVFAEAAGVPNAFLYLAIRVDVEVHAFGIRAFTVFAEKPALRHLLQVIFVQEFAILSLLAKPSQPMFANYRFIGSTVFESAGVAFRAGAFQEETTNVEGGGVGGVVKFFEI